MGFTILFSLVGAGFSPLGVTIDVPFVFIFFTYPPACLCFFPFFFFTH